MADDAFVPEGGAGGHGGVDVEAGAEAELVGGRPGRLGELGEEGLGDLGGRGRGGLVLLGARLVACGQAKPGTPDNAIRPPRIT